MSDAREFIDGAPVDVSKVQHRESRAWHHQILVVRTLSPRLWFSKESTGWRIRQPRFIRGIHALLLDHNGLASRLAVYSQLPKYLPPRKKDHMLHWRPGLAGSKDPRYRRQITEAIYEAKRLGLIDVIQLPDGAVKRTPPGRACGTCGMWLSPGDIEAQRSQEPCPGPTTASGVEAEWSGGTSTDRC